MSEILQYVITSLITFLTTGGIGSIFYFRLQKRLKESEVKISEAEVRSAEITNLSNTNEEWVKLYNDIKEEKQSLETQLVEANRLLHEKSDEYLKSKDDLWEKYSVCRQECDSKERCIMELNWYRCEINGCPYRKPPRLYGEMEFPEHAKSSEFFKNLPEGDEQAN